MDIRKDYLQAIEMVDEDWVITDEWLEIIKNSDLTVKEKAQNIWKLIWMFDWNTDAIDKEIARLTKIKKSYTWNKNRVKEWLSYNLQEMGVDKLDTELYKISFRNSKSVLVLEEEIIPEEYRTEKVVHWISKTDILKDLKDWKEIPWVVLKESSNLQIK